MSDSDFYSQTPEEWGASDQENKADMTIIDDTEEGMNNFADILNQLSTLCRSANDTWWRDPETGQPITRNKGELLALIHSEISECLEGERKSLMDDHLPHRPMAEVELADALIRIFDYAGEYGYDIGGAFIEKIKYNAERPDHKPENRVKGGKKF